MSGSTKKFLKPVSVLIASLLSATMQSSIQANPTVDAAAKTALKAIDMGTAKTDQRPDPLTIKPSEQTKIAQGHYSHMSHRSHSSHRSHTSGYFS